jgi:membrane protease YdiL (CAAX protease family)
MERRGVLVFLLIAFGLAWAGVLVAQLAGASMENPLVQLPMAFSPAVAAFVVRRWVTKEGFRDTGLALRLREAKAYYLLALVGPVVLVAAMIALAGALGLYRPDAAPLPGPLSVLGSLGIAVATMPIFFGEEFGWRSYLQQRLGRRPLRAVIITGVIWGVWHYPLAFTEYVDYANPVLGLTTWTIHAVLLAIILAWLFVRSRSIWVPCLAHAGNNMIIGMFSGALLMDGSGLDPATVDLIGLAPLAAIAGWIVFSGQLSRGVSLPQTHDVALTQTQKGQAHA